MTATARPAPHPARYPGPAGLLAGELATTVVDLETVLGPVASELVDRLRSARNRCGYADQAHLTREWRELAGCTRRTGWSRSSHLRWPEGGRIMFRTGEGEFGVKPGNAALYVVTDQPDALFERATAAGAEVGDLPRGLTGTRCFPSRRSHWLESIPQVSRTE